MTKTTTITSGPRTSPDTKLEGHGGTYPPTPHTTQFVVEHPEGEEEGYKMDIEALATDRSPTMPTPPAYPGMLNPTRVPASAHVLKFPNMPSMQSVHSQDTVGVEEIGGENGPVSIRRPAPVSVPLPPSPDSVDGGRKMSAKSGGGPNGRPTTASMSIFDFDSLTLPPSVRNQDKKKKNPGRTYSASLFSNGSSAGLLGRNKHVVRHVFAPVTKIVSPIVLRVVWVCLVRCSAWAGLFALVLTAVMFVIPFSGKHGHARGF